ncbi:hypothetical protein [Pseudorhodobacter sp.]|uniref:hypothetical protein n=1 Tax=Pseudorhodobacter sp. TaxID=1934400 RepID=UPI0039E302FC
MPFCLLAVARVVEFGLPVLAGLSIPPAKIMAAPARRVFMQKKPRKEEPDHRSDHA